MLYGPLLTRQYGPNPKESKLSIQEMDDNLLYLEELALGETLESLITFSATEILVGQPGIPITNLVAFKNDALILPTTVSATSAGANSAGYTIQITTTLPNAATYDWAIEMGNVAAIPFFSRESRVGVDYTFQNLSGGIVCNVDVYSTLSAIPLEYTIDNIVLRVTAKLKP